MKAVILAAGKGTRMGSLSVETPKPLLKVLGKTLLEHKLDMLPDSIDEVIVVVGYLKEKIIEQIGSSYKNKKITYIVQDEHLGTAHALFLCKYLLKEKFLVLMGDDIYSKEDIEECLKYDWAILVKEMESMKSGGQIIFDDEGNLEDIFEGDHSGSSGWISTNMFSLLPDIFNYEMVKKDPTSKEFGLPQTILSANKDFKIKVVQSRFWLQITTPEDLKTAETFLSIKN